MSVLLSTVASKITTVLLMCKIIIILMGSGVKFGRVKIMVVYILVCRLSIIQISYERGGKRFAMNIICLGTY